MLPATPPTTLPLAYLFPGAGHVSRRSAWDDPNATWAFFGCGPQYAGHSRDDEGHFLICKRGQMVAFENATNSTYAAADISAGYHSNKAREVTRQFLYLRGEREFFLVFDRVEATRPEFRRHFFLHVPTEPQVDGIRLSLPAAEGDKAVLSQGKSRMIVTTVLPANAQIVVRGGPDHDAWGHPLESTAQYNHATEGRKKPPLCPWRIEVGDPNQGARTLFLHVFEIGDETDRQPSDVELIAPAGVDIGGRWRVEFNATGPLRGKIGDRDFASTVHTEAQYSVRAA